jgi:hypothetical protein
MTILHQYASNACAGCITLYVKRLVNVEMSQHRCSGRKGELQCPRGPHSVNTQTHDTGDHGTRVSPCGRNGEAHPETGPESQDGVTRHNRAIPRPREWHRGSHPSVNYMTVWAPISSVVQPIIPRRMGKRSESIKSLKICSVLVL